MKKHARLTILLLAVALICSLALVLAACDSKEDNAEKTPSHLVFDTPSSSLVNPVSTEEFKFSDVKMYDVYTDGSRSNAITFDESMLSPSNEGNLDSLKPGETARIVFTACYNTGGVTLDKSTFAIYFKRPDNVERVTYKFYTNGANVEDFELQIPVGTVFNTYQEFLTYIETNYELVAKTRYTLAGWLDTQGQDVYGMEAAQIERNYGRYNMANNFVKIEVKKGYSNYFYATWTKNVAKVTFDYNFMQFGITTAKFAHVTPAINVDELGETKDDQPIIVTTSNSTVTEYYTMGYDTAERPNTYEVDSFGNIASKQTPLQEIIPGYTFDGWYTDKEFTKVWSFSGVVKETMTLYAKWSKKQYTITLDLGGGFFNTDYIKIQDDSYYENDDYGNYVTRGVVVRSDELSDVNDETAVKSPTVIRYTGLEYKANVFGTTNKSYYLLKTLSNVNVSSNRVFYKGKINNNTYYYDFAGWFYDANFNQPFELNNNSFTEDLYLYAKWELVSDPSLQASYYKDYLFKNCLELKADGTYKITGINDKTVTTFTIPISIGGVYVTEIGSGAFMSCLSLLKVEISGGTSSKLSKIGDKAFAFCSKLSEINKICDGTSFSYDLFNVEYQSTQQKDFVHLFALADIGVDVFQGTEYLQDKKKSTNFLEYEGRLIQYIGDSTVTNIVADKNDLPDDGNGTATIGSKNYTIDNSNPLMYVYSLPGEPTLKYSYFGSGISVINPYAFKNLTNLKSITIPDTVLEIGDSCFSKCSALEAFIIEKSGEEYNLESIGASALSDTLWLSSQSNIVTIGKILYSFRGGSDTTQITIPDGVEIIADNLFSYNDNLRIITFANESKIKKIGKNAFNATAWYRAQGENNNGFVTINGILIGYTVKPAAVDGKVIVTVPNSVRAIASYAFTNTNTITHISLPSSVEAIEPYAFDACTKLQTISFGHVTVADGMTSKAPALLEGVALSDKAFFNSRTDNFVSNTLTLYFTVNRINGGRNCFEYATAHSNLSAYYAANASFIKELNIVAENGIRVKEGTLETEYVRNSGWTLSNYWFTKGAFENKAIIQIEKTDGLVYEEYLTMENVSGYTNDLTPSSAEDVALYGMDIYNGKRSLTITYTDPNSGLEHVCSFEYTIRPKISKITIDAKPLGVDTFMSLATYYTTSNLFVTKGGVATISYDLNGVASQTVSIDKLLSVKDIEGNKDVKFTIENLMFSNAQNYTLAFRFVFGGQTVETVYEYAVNAPVITKIAEKELIEFDIAAEITKSMLSDVYLTMSRNDPKNGGQIYAVTGVNVYEDGTYEITGDVYNYDAVPEMVVITNYIVYYADKDEEGNSVIKEKVISLSELSEYLNNQDIAVSDGGILLYSDAEFTKKLTKFDTSVDGEHVIYAKYNSSNGAVGGSPIRYTVLLRTSQSLFKYTVDMFKDNPYGAEFAGTIYDADGNICTYNGVATITGIDSSHWTTVSVPEYITEKVAKIDAETGVAVTDEEGNPVYEYYYYVVTAIGSRAFKGDLVLNKVYFSKYVTSIGDEAFMGCENLADIDLLNEEVSQVKTIGESVFEGCLALTAVPFDKYAGGVLEEIGRCSFKNSGIVSFNFANTPLVIEIEEQLFYECKSLTDVNFGSVKVINNQAFQSCISLIKVELPDAIDAIGNYAFSACNALSAVIIYDASPSGISIGTSEPFGSATTILKIYVPDGSVEAFKNDASFVLYKDLIFNVNDYVAP